MLACWNYPCKFVVSRTSPRQRESDSLVRKGPLLFRIIPVTCPPKPGPGIMLEFLTKEDGIWPGKDEHQNRL